MKQKHIQHLYSRASFGIDIEELKKLKTKPKKKIVTNLLKTSSKSEPIKLDLSELDIYKEKTYQQIKKELGEDFLQKLQQKSREKTVKLNQLWIERLFKNSTELREKMTLFWANVFVCRDNNILLTHHYHNTLRANALGNFRDFTKAISKEPAMIKYLNLRQNVKRKPNENFARELMELFTLGIGNYTEQDIKEAARAFTGYNFKRDGSFIVRKWAHDTGIKTFFGKTGNFDGDAIIDIILEQKQCARFICKKVYTYFVNPIIDNDNLEEITEIFYKNYDINNLMTHIFSSKWFYEEKNIGVKIKSPIELLAGIYKVVPYELINKKQLNFLQKMMGQMLLNPPNVAGWKGGKSWIDSNTLMFRLKLPSLLLNNAVINLEEKGEFEDSFEMYYKRMKKAKRHIKTVKNWDAFQKKYDALTTKELKEFILISKIDADTDDFLDNLKFKSNKDFCVQLMSIPEYQLC